MCGVQLPGGVGAALTARGELQLGAEVVGRHVQIVQGDQAVAGRREQWQVLAGHQLAGELVDGAQVPGGSDQVRQVAAGAAGVGKRFEDHGWRLSQVGGRGDKRPGGRNQRERSSSCSQSAAGA